MLVIIHKLCRYVYVSVYFYIMPFMIITFRVILLYYTELYPDEKESSAVPSASVADVTQAQT